MLRRSLGSCLFVAAGVLVLFAGCSTEPETPLGSGVDPEKPLTEISESEHVDVCGAANDYSLERTTVKENCLYAVLSGVRVNEDALSARSTDELRQSCREQVDFCVESGGSGQYVQNACWQTSRCSARVEEFEECLISLAARFDEVVNELPTCDELTFELLVAAKPLLEPAALGTRACDGLGDSCGWARLVEDGEEVTFADGGASRWPRQGRDGGGSGLARCAAAGRPPQKIDGAFQRKKAS